MVHRESLCGYLWCNWPSGSTPRDSLVFVSLGKKKQFLTHIMNFVAKITRFNIKCQKNQRYRMYMCCSSLTTSALLGPAAAAKHSERYVAKQSSALFSELSPCSSHGSLQAWCPCHLFPCLCPLTVKAQLPLFHNISQIINTFVILYLHLNLIFGIARPGIYHKACVVNGLIEKLVSRQLVLGDLSSRPHFWKRHCSKWEGREEKRFLVVLLTGIFLFLEIINMDRPSCLSGHLSQIALLTAVEKT